MDYARLKQVEPNDELYEKAKKQFEKANAIQAGTASYNLACIYGLRGDKDACLKALELSRDKVTLPDQAEILTDPDMATVVDQEWFKAFLEELNKKVVEEPEVKEVVVNPTASKWKLTEKSFDVEDATAAEEEAEADTEAVDNK